MKRLIAIIASITILCSPGSFVSALDTTTGASKHDQLLFKLDQAKADAKSRSLAAKENAAMRRLTVTKQRCETMKTRLDQTIPKLSDNITTLKQTLDKHYLHIKSLHDDGKLTTDRYDELVVAAQLAKVKSEVAIELIDPSSISVDCNDVSLGTRLDSYRLTIAEVRTYLKDYHTSLVSLISDMNASSTTASGGAK